MRCSAQYKNLDLDIGTKRRVSRGDCDGKRLQRSDLLVLPALEEGSATRYLRPCLVVCQYLPRTELVRQI